MLNDVLEALIKILIGNLAQKHENGTLTTTLCRSIKEH